MTGPGTPKTLPELPTENPEPGRCNFFLSGRKARFCRSMAVPGQRFCGNHLHIAGGLASAATPAAARRVPCPLDPSHDVLESELEVHITKRCPALLMALKERTQPHFHEDINVGSDLEPELPPPPPPQPSPPPAAAAAAAASAQACGQPTPSPQQPCSQQPPGQNPRPDPQPSAGPQPPQAIAAATATAAAGILSCSSVGSGCGGGGSGGGGDAQLMPALGPFQKGRAAQRAALARSLGASGFSQLLSRVEAAHAAVCCGPEAPPLRVLRPAECEEMLAAPSHTRPFDLKHGLQQASIVGNMQHAGLLAPGPQGGAGVAVVELGAGKGYLGGTLAQCCGVGRLVATDIKAGLTRKADRHLRHIVFGRHRVDLKDYIPAATPELTSGPADTTPTVPWVAVAKHLCGAATDYGLRACLVPYSRQKSRTGPAEPAPAAGAAAGRASVEPSAGAAAAAGGYGASAGDGLSGAVEEGQAGTAGRRRRGVSGPLGGKRHREDGAGPDADLGTGPDLAGEGDGSSAGVRQRAETPRPQREEGQWQRHSQDAPQQVQVQAAAEGTGGEHLAPDGGCPAGMDDNVTADPRVVTTDSNAANQETYQETKPVNNANGNGGGDRASVPAGGTGASSGGGGSGGSSGSGGSRVPVFRGLAIAPCCHHRCGWRAYVGKPLFRRLGLSAQDFELVSWMTGWALCGHDTPAGAVETSDADGEDVGEEEDKNSGGGRRDNGGRGGGGDDGDDVDCRAGDGDGAQATAANAAAADAGVDGSATRNGKLEDQQTNCDGDQASSAAQPAADTGTAAAGTAEEATAAAASFDPASALSRSTKMAIGRKCKLLIEAGRLDWLRGRFRSTELVSYIGPEVTGENRLLLAVGPTVGQT